MVTLCSGRICVCQEWGVMSMAEWFIMVAKHPYLKKKVGLHIIHFVHACASPAVIVSIDPSVSRVYIPYYFM